MRGKEGGKRAGKEGGRLGTRDLSCMKFLIRS